MPTAVLFVQNLTFSDAAWAAPETYYDAKHFLRNDIYADQNNGPKASYRGASRALQSKAAEIASSGR
ncbi:hypothetical protein GCM10009425_49390 [Pseudomonas asuensis]|uniref:Uncharacterized protein n=1 Tax=Pseudomonas asuensis TaxID=1825787 RepID=A0ABQ2H520_9PSED|nr:hypothetical protein GCM10009425_49390 [Pseudomonas asuensis]